jgi:hypothetical protein
MAMGRTAGERYAVVSCHVERLLDDAVWRRYRRLLQLRPGGFPVASLLRPPDGGAGEDERRWLERARQARELGPLGHHPHWTAPDHARPTGGDPGERVRREGAWLAEHGLPARLFCGGGWYTDEAVAEAAAALGYVDCTPRPARPTYLEDGARWAELAAPARIRLPSDALLVTLPTTRSLGELVEGLPPWRPFDEKVVHVYFHDTDLLDARRRLVLTGALRALRLRRAPAEPETLARGAATTEVAWRQVARPAGSGGDTA